MRAVVQSGRATGGVRLCNSNSWPTSRTTPTRKRIQSICEASSATPTKPRAPAPRATIGNSLAILVHKSSPEYLKSCPIRPASRRLASRAVLPPGVQLPSCRGEYVSIGGQDICQSAAHLGEYPCTRLTVYPQSFTARRFFGRWCKPTRFFNAPKPCLEWNSLSILTMRQSTLSI